MRGPPSYEHSAMLATAWDAALKLLDERGAPLGDASAATGRFLKRKACRGIAVEGCEKAFADAAGVARYAIEFRRSRCGMLPPVASRRYELLHELACGLEAQFPEAHPQLVQAGCGLVEAQWIR